MSDNNPSPTLELQTARALIEKEGYMVTLGLIYIELVKIRNMLEDRR